MAWRSTSLVAVALMGACRSAPGPKDDTGGGGAETPSECTHAAPPEIEDLSVEEGEPTADGPTLLVRLSGTDADGDLQEYEVDLWFDEVVNGAVEQGEANHIAPGPVSLEAGPCGAPEISSEIEIVLLGDDVLAYDTPMEFAAVLTDGAGLSSDPAITTAQTPEPLSGR